MNANNYKNIIFDFGGVIININYDLTTKAFRELGLDNFDELFSKLKQSDLFDRYEKGGISSTDFRNELKAGFHLNVDDATFDKAWNAMLLDIPNERLTLLKHLKSTHRTFLLSNTNQIHIEAIYKRMKAEMNIPDFSVYFEKIYLSYKVKMRKPDPEIFELVLRENNLDPAETLFIDDSPQHLEGAKKLGIQTYWLDVNNESIMDLF